MTETPSFTITLEQEQGFDFRVRFDWPDNPEGRTVHERKQIPAEVA